MRKKTDLSAPSRLERLRGGKPQRSVGGIERHGGDKGAGLITGYAIITRGEALGHDAWVDQVMQAQARDGINAAGPAGIKSRFTHPSLSGDGLGKFLGRTKNAWLDGDVLRGDLHFDETAHETPEGDLAGYVLDLAESDPRAFAASIVFERDAAAEDAFRKAHSEEGRFSSPDAGNKKNLPHLRVGRMHGSDVVDEPAANPGGMFSQGIAAEADALCEYALGLSAAPPVLTKLSIGIDAQRLRGFAGRFLRARGLTLAQATETPMPENKIETPAPVSAPQTQPASNDISDDELHSAGRQVELDRFAALQKKWPDDPAFVNKCFADGLSLEQAGAARKDHEIATLRKEVDELKKGQKRLAEGVEFGGADDAAGGRTFLGEVKKLRAEKNCSLREAMGQVARDEPELYEAHKAAIPPMPRKAKR